MTAIKKEISASDFKKHFLSLVDEVKNNHSSFIITKRKIPIATVVPLENQTNEKDKSFFGFMKGNVKINGEIINFDTSDDWEVINGK